MQLSELRTLSAARIVWSFGPLDYCTRSKKKEGKLEEEDLTYIFLVSSIYLFSISPENESKILLVQKVTKTETASDNGSLSTLSSQVLDYAQGNDSNI